MYFLHRCNKKIPRGEKLLEKVLTKQMRFDIILGHLPGRLAQLGEHLPYKQRVTGSSPVLSTKGKQQLPHFIGDGLVAQLVRALACHARGRGFEPHPDRHSDMPL